jgi:SSS family solute:Na+ symporter
VNVIDWTVVVVLNGAIIAYGLYRSRETKTSSDWFLAARSLPWWIVGLSLWATAIDSSDLIADSGGTYRLGLSYFVANWVGTVIGWVLAAYFVVVPMYRAGMYTNAEYLEARFGPSARVISALVQVLYRTVVLGIIATTIYLTLTIVCGWAPAVSWSVVVAIALLATVYTALGGLRSVAVTDALQSVVMVLASVILFAIVFKAVGGWTGIGERLDSHQPGLADQMLQIRHDHVTTEKVSAESDVEIERMLLLGGEHDAGAQTITRRTPAWLMAAGLILMGMSYSIVNHTQSMRLLGARSVWDLKMSATVAGAILLVTTFLNLMIGVMGRALHPTLPPEVAQYGNDSIYPLLVRDLAVGGYAGLIVAGVMAACFSTYDSIGSALSSLLVRDVYARLLVRDRDDRHYLRVGQWLTPAIIFGSFVYVPFILKEGMLAFYIGFLSAFVAPLLTIYLMGVFTRVHRRSGTIGMLVGVAFGVLRLLAPQIAINFGIAVLPPVLMDTYGAWLFGVVITAATMLVVSLIYGWEKPGALLHESPQGWLRESRDQLREQDQSGGAPRSTVLPAVLALLVIAVGMVLSFVVFW